jgi:2-isopropylmalate synthase
VQAPEIRSEEDTDILVASAKAYINALNLMQAGQKAHPQVADV